MKKRVINSKILSSFNSTETGTVFSGEIKNIDILSFELRHISGSGTYIFLPEFSNNGSHWRNYGTTIPFVGVLAPPTFVNSLFFIPVPIGFSKFRLSQQVSAGDLTYDAWLFGKSIGGTKHE